MIRLYNLLFNLLLILFIVIVLLWNCNDWFSFLLLDYNYIYYSDITVIADNSYNNNILRFNLDDIVDDTEEEDDWPEGCKFKRVLMYDVKTKKLEHVIIDVSGNKKCDIWQLLAYLEESEREGKTEYISKTPTVIGIACIFIWLGYYTIQYSKYFRDSW